MSNQTLFELLDADASDAVIGTVSGGMVEEGHLEINKMPRFEAKIPDESGIELRRLAVGRNVKIRRGGVVIFQGVVETPASMKDGRVGTHLTIRGSSRGHKLLQGRICDSYDYDEDGNPKTTRDAVTVNPWNPFIFRNPSGTIDANSQLPALDGVTPDEAAKALIGTGFYPQHDYFDNSPLLASTVIGSGKRMTVYQDKEGGDLRPSLSLSRLGESSYAPSGVVESIPLENGDPNIDAMGNITSTDVLLIGEKATGQDPTIRVCRNARDTRTYNSVSLTHTANYLGSGLDAWEGSLTFADAPANKNSLGYELTLDTGETDSEYVFYDPNSQDPRAVRSGDTGFSWDFIDVDPGDTIEGSAGDTYVIDSDNLVMAYADVTTSNIYFQSSSDGGETWTAPSDTGISPTGSAAIFQRVGIVAFSSTTYVITAFDSDSTASTWISTKTTDSGATWGSAVTAATVGPFGDSSVGSTPIVVLDSSNAILLYRHTTNFDLMCVKTTDAGSTWGTPVIVYNGTASDNVAIDTSNCIAAFSTSTIVATYKASRPSGGDSLRDAKVARSTDGGATWASTTLKTFTDTNSSPAKANDAGLASIAVATADATDGVILFSSTAVSTNTASIWRVETTNSGSSWSTPTEIYKERVDSTTAYEPRISLISEGAEVYSALLPAHPIFDRSIQLVTTDSFDSYFVNDTPQLNVNIVNHHLITAGSWPDATDATKLFYTRLSAVTASDTGVTEGSTFTAYSNPVTFLDGAEDWIETDLIGMNRLDALEKVRSHTESDESVNPSPHWDMWLNQDLELQFAERRGSAIANHPYSFEAGNLESIDHEYYGEEVAYQTIAYGAGSGTAQTRIVSASEFSAGGLRDAANDPNGTATYGDAARVMQFIDSGETSITSLLHKARAFHKLHRVPQENFKATIIPEHIRFFGVGDEITVEDITTDSNDALRVTQLTRRWSGNDRERISIDLGIDRKTTIDTLRNGKSSQVEATILSKPSTQVGALAGSGVYCDISHPGVFSFSIPDGSVVDRILVELSTLPWNTQISSMSIEDGTAVDHSHTPIPGITTFTGDSGGSSGDPVYGANIRFALDPTVDAVGYPTDFGGDSFPAMFGTSGARASMSFDVTGYAEVDSNGVIKSGVHRIFIKPGVGADNVRGLAHVGVAVTLKFKGNGGGNV